MKRFRRFFQNVLNPLPARAYAAHGKQRAAADTCWLLSPTRNAARSKVEDACKAYGDPSLTPVRFVYR